MLQVSEPTAPVYSHTAHAFCIGRYQALAVSSGVESGSSNKNDARHKGIDADASLSMSQSMSKRVLPEWTFNLGECALGIQTSQRVKNNPQSVLVLGKSWARSVIRTLSSSTHSGERNLFCFHDNGQLLFMSKFEYNPSAFIIYTPEMNNNGKCAEQHREHQMQDTTFHV